MVEQVGRNGRPRVPVLRGRLRQLPRELVIVLAGVLFYFGGRGLTESSPAPALEHARDIVAFEKSLGLYWEPAWQALVDGSHALVSLMNWIYIWGHWPVIAVTLLWLVLRHPTVYRRTRNAMVASGAIGMVVFVLYPVAPPRLAGLDLLDTVTLHSNAYRVLQPPGFTNQYAAMPSLHFGWDLIIGIAIATAAHHRLVRVVGCVLPLFMGTAVVFTANHYLVDVLAGGAVAMVGFAIALRYEHRAIGRTGDMTTVPGRPAALPASTTGPGDTVVDLPRPRVSDQVADSGRRPT